MKIKNATNRSTNPRTYRVLGKVLAPGATAVLPEWARSNRKVYRLAFQGKIQILQDQIPELKAPPSDLQVPEPPTPEVVEASEEERLEEESEDLDLSTLRKTDLQELMEEKGLSYKGSDSKASLIEALSDG